MLGVLDMDAWQIPSCHHLPPRAKLHTASRFQLGATCLPFTTVPCQSFEPALYNVVVWQGGPVFCTCHVLFFFKQENRDSTHVSQPFEKGPRCVNTPSPVRRRCDQALLVYCKGQRCADWHERACSSQCHLPALPWVAASRPALSSTHQQQPCVCGQQHILTARIPKRNNSPAAPLATSTPGQSCQAPHQAPPTGAAATSLTNVFPTITTHLLPPW